MTQPANATFDLLTDLATLEFEPLLPNPDIKPPPSNGDWAAMAGGILVYTRWAWVTLHKTKAEVLVMIERERSDPDLALEITEGIRNAAAFFTAMAEITQEAHRRRLICRATIAD
jgi:hypothetical protein